MARRMLVNDAQHIENIANNNLPGDTGGQPRRTRRRRNRRRKKRIRAQEAMFGADLLEDEKEIEMKIENSQPTGAHEQRASLLSLLSPATRTWAEAVVHPFGQDGVGCMLPDGKGDAVVPALDRWSFDVVPGAFDLPAVAPSPARECIGLGLVLMPRCLAVGWLTGTEVAAPADGYNEVALDGSGSLPITFLESDLKQQGVGDSCNAGYPCVLVLFGITDFGQCTRIVPNAPVGAQADLGVNFVSLTRTHPFNQNTENFRMLAGGIKLFSDEAPLNTGGTVYGGQISPDQLYDLLRQSAGTTNYVSPGVVGNIERTMLQRKAFRGVDGATSRYNPVQDPEHQLEFVKTSTDNDNLAQIRVGAESFVSTPYVQDVEINTNLDPSSFDAISAGTNVPMIVWKFNVDSRYTLRAAVRAHYEGTPSGDSPFLSHNVNYQPGIEDLFAFLNNRERFPTVSKGQSFKSFFQRAQHITSTVSRYAAKAGKIAKLVEEFL